MPIRSLRSCGYVVGFEFVILNQDMKITILTTALAGLGLAVLPLQASDNQPEQPNPTQETTAAKTITTYVVHYGGGG